MRSRRFVMANDKDIGILSVEKDGEDGLIVTFSDGTISGYLAQELLELRPNREPVEEWKSKIPPQIHATDK
jgi:hypothetical protein